MSSSAGLCSPSAFGRAAAGGLQGTWRGVVSYRESSWQWRLPTGTVSSTRLVPGFCQLVLLSLSLLCAMPCCAVQGYTEPDPRDDLNGTDVARKVAILARECGLMLELDDIPVESLVRHMCDTLGAVLCCAVLGQSGWWLAGSLQFSAALSGPALCTCKACSETNMSDSRGRCSQCVVRYSVLLPSCCCCAGSRASPCSAECAGVHAAVAGV